MTIPEWLKVAIGVIALISVSVSPALIYEWPWLEQTQTSQSQRTPTEHGPPDAASHHYDSDAIHRHPLPPESTTPANETQAPKLKQPTTTNRRADFDDKDNGMHDLSAWATVAVTIGLLIVAVVQAGIYRNQARIMRSQLTVAAAAARASRRSADALPALERAYLFLVISAIAISRMRRIPELNDTISDLGNIEYEFVNEGKTPAIITRVSAQFEHLTELPKVLVYRDSFYGGEYVVRAGGTYPPPRHWSPLAGVLVNPDTTTSMRFQRISRLSVSLTHDAIESLKAGQSFLWFYGRVVYDDVFGREHETASAGAITGSPIASKDTADQSTTIAHSARTART